MDPIVVRLGGYQGPDSINTRGGARFGAALKERLGDRIAFELVGDVLALGRQSGELPDMVESGELSLCYLSTVRFAPLVPELTVFELPFVVRERSLAIGALNGELGERFRTRMLETTPFRALGFWDNGFRHITNSVRPIRTPADCRGLRIRTQLSELHAETFAALGFEPVPSDIKEFVEQIGTDRFQAHDNPLTNIHHFGVHRYHRHITLTGHFFGASALVCSESWYRSIPTAVREAVEAAAREATLFQQKLAAAEDDAVLAALRRDQNDVIHLTAPELHAFVREVEPVRVRHSQHLDPKLFSYLA